MSSLTKKQVIAAEGEQKASRALKEASDIITESAAALQLRSILSITINIITKNIFNGIITEFSAALQL